MLSNAEVSLPDAPRGAWKMVPVVQVPSPIAMNYRTGKGSLYYIEYAEQVIAHGRIMDQPPEFVGFARRLVDWLTALFTSERGRHTIDNLAEFERLKGGW